MAENNVDIDDDEIISVGSPSTCFSVSEGDVIMRSIDREAPAVNDIGCISCSSPSSAHGADIDPSYISPLALGNPQEFEDIISPLLSVSTADDSRPDPIHHGGL